MDRDAGPTVLRTLAESPFIDARDWHSFRIAAVEAASFGSGAGSEFRVELLLNERAEASARQRSIAPTLQARKYWVLVVEDNVDAAESPAGLVRLLGHEVEVAFRRPERRLN